MKHQGKQRIQDIHPAPETDRTGQKVQICYMPLMVYQVTGWNAEKGVWDATCVIPSGKLTPLYFREDFLAQLDTRKGDETP